MSERSGVSAGILLFRRRRGGLEVLLAHPGGPFWRGRDAGAWTIPKGLVAPGEALLDAAEHFLRLESFRPSQVLERRIQEAEPPS